VVKLAVAIQDLSDLDDSASPGFDSRPMHSVPACAGIVLLLFGKPIGEDVQCL
jgi:hypothetical protein